MTDFIKFPKIRQFRDVVRHVRAAHDFVGLDDDKNAIYEHRSEYPKIEFLGTPKLHGTNAAIVTGENLGEIDHIQSRSRKISVQSDNAGFAAFVAGLPSEVIQLFGTRYAWFGEWCGGNIQKGVAICELPKMFVIFKVKDLFQDAWVDFSNLDEKTQELLNSNRIYSINQFPSFKLEIDFEKPELATEKLQEITLEVEKECPVGKHFGVSGVGEGVVWQSTEDPSSKFWFKVKGEKHSVTRVKKLASVDIEKLNSVHEFVEATVTKNRLEQGLSVMKERDIEITRKSTGDYLRWVVSDILEEEIDLLTKSGLCADDVCREISKKARVFWFETCDNEF